MKSACRLESYNKAITMYDCTTVTHHHEVGQFRVFERHAGRVEQVAVPNPGVVQQLLGRGPGVRVLAHALRQKVPARSQYR